MPQANKPDNDVLAGLGADDQKKSTTASAAATTTPPAGQGQSYEKPNTGDAGDAGQLIHTNDIEIKVVNATELNPDSAYLIVLDEHVYSTAEGVALLDALKNIGIKNTVAMSAPHDKAIRIIKQDSEKKDV